jgi:hypothetical protein
MDALRQRPETVRAHEQHPVIVNIMVLGLTAQRHSRQDVVVLASMLSRGHLNYTRVELECQPNRSKALIPTPGEAFWEI